MSNNVIQNYLKKMFGENEKVPRKLSVNKHPIQKSVGASILTPKMAPNEILNSFLRGK